ncbi:hypothetical protein L7F22_022030 [Adiantum nelumboides]|nr:hypothetical protein [Adiantum nelumboides]
MCAMVATRPDIAHAVGVVSRFMANPGRLHWDAVKSIMRYLKGTKHKCLCYGKGPLELKGFCDSDMSGNVDTRKSTSGYAFTLAGGAVSWRFRLQKIVALSTTEAEYISATEASKEAIWLARLCSKFGLPDKAPMLGCDSQSAICLAKNAMFHARTKHIDVRYHFIREVLEDGLITLVKVFFFGQLSILEIQKLVERLINYFIFKGLFLALIAQPDVMQITLWLVWFSVLGFLKVFQGLAKDRLERLNASPTATMFAHGRVFAVLVLVLMFSLFWIQLCVFMFKDTGINTLLLLLFEPLSMAFDTLQAVVVHGVQLYDTWHRHTVDEVPKTKQARPSERYAAAAAWEWRGSLLQNFGFAMDVVSYLLALSHCLHIWWLRGLAFKLVDGVLFLNLRALLSAILKRIKGFMKVKTAMSTLQCALPDATEEELLAYDDDCAICKEPMGKAKQLPCAHLFHLPCLRSWLDQGLAEAYSCPTCRRPLFMGSGKNSLESRQHFSGDNPTQRGGESTGYPAATETQVLSTFTQRTASSTRMHDPFTTPHWDSAFPNTWSETEAWADSFHVAAASENNGSSSGAGTLGSGRMETVMQHLTGSRMPHSQHELSSSASWGWWPFSHGMGGSSQVGAGAVDQHTSQLIHRTVGLGNRSQDFAGPSRLRAMVDTVREVLPNVSEETIVQDQSCWYLPFTFLLRLDWPHPPSVVMWSIRDAAAIFGTQEDRLRTWAQEMVSGICRGFSVPWVRPSAERIQYLVVWAYGTEGVMESVEETVQQ